MKAPAHHAVMRFVELQGAGGLNVRSASQIARTALRYEADIRIAWNSRSASATSVIELLALGAPLGSPLRAVAIGRQSYEVLVALQDLVTNTIRSGTEASVPLVPQTVPITNAHRAAARNERGI